MRLNELHVILRHVGELRGSLLRILEISQAIHQADPPRIRPRPYPALPDRIDLLRSLPAPRGDAGDELLVASVDLRLDELTRLLAERPGDGERAGERRRADTIDADTDLAQGLVDGRNDGEDAYRAGERRRTRPDLVRGRGDVVAARGREITHGDHERLARRAQRLQLPIDLFRSGDTAAGAVYAQHDGLDVLIDPRLPDQLRQRVAADGAGRLPAVRDVAGGDDDTDAGTAIAIVELLLCVDDPRVVFRGNPVEGAGRLVLTDHADQLPLHLQVVHQSGDQLRLQSHFGRISVGAAHGRRQRADVTRDGIRRELACCSQGLLIARPEHIEIGEALLLVGRRHVVARKDLYRALEGPDPEDVDVDAELLQQPLEVERIAAEALDHHVPGRIEVNPVGLRREVILILVEGRAVGDDWLAARTEFLDGARELLEHRLAGALHLVEIEHQHPNASVRRGAANGIEEIPEQRLLTLLSLCVLECALNRIAAQLLDEGSLRLNDERRALGYARKR